MSDMRDTPAAVRKHIAIVGKTNAGKSTLFNMLTSQDRSIVSAHPGTTTDPVRATMELVPFGPVVITDTAGLEDSSELGTERMKRTWAELRKSDAVLFVMAASDPVDKLYEEFKKRKIPHILVITKADDRCTPDRFPDAFVLKKNGGNVEKLREKLSSLLSRLNSEPDSIIADIVLSGSRVLLVTPIDSEAPKGRMILPQMQVLRDCLDNGIICTVCRETELQKAYSSDISLVITDSQVFSYVEERLPKKARLTSFSILLARRNGNFTQYLKGAKTLDMLEDGDKILMLEGCTHNSTHEDIGRVKLPASIKKKTGKNITYEFCSGYDFPDSTSGYKMAIQCGSCMINRREVLSRLEIFEKNDVPVTNYGLALAWGSGILERSTEIF